MNASTAGPVGDARRLAPCQHHHDSTGLGGTAIWAALGNQVAETKGELLALRTTIHTLTQRLPPPPAV